MTSHVNTQFTLKSFCICCYYWDLKTSGKDQNHELTTLFIKPVQWNTHVVLV